MKDLLEFFSFSDPNTRYVVAGTVLLGVSSAIVGAFTFLKKKALVGDAVAHAVLPGVCLAFLLSGTKNPFYLIIGAFVTGWLSLVAIDQIVARSRIKEDTAIGLILSVSFGLGIMILTRIQHSGNAAQSGLDSFLFGKAAALVGQDVLVFSSISLLLLVVVFFFYKELKLIAFDEDFARSIGFPVRRLELVLTTLTVLAVVVGIQAVGVVLMAAMLITPAAAARFWTDRLPVMLLLAAIFGGLSGIFGAYVSYAAPAMPTGPWIVMVVSFIAMISFFFAPGKGILHRILRQGRLKKQIRDENILKIFYQLGENTEQLFDLRTMESLSTRKDISNTQLRAGLRRLSRQRFIKSREGKYQLTIEGKNKGQRLIKLHRLWELYLTRYLRIAPDHVHEDAETIEHIITPEIEAKLEKLLDFPEEDPHHSKIPYSS